MSITNGEAAMADMTDQATYQRLEKDVSGMKNDIAARADQITKPSTALPARPANVQNAASKKPAPTWIRRSTTFPRAAARCWTPRAKCRELDRGYAGRGHRAGLALGLGF